MDNIPEVAGSPVAITNAEFIKLTIFNEYANIANTSVYTFSSSYKSEVIGGVTYLPMGGFLAVGTQQRDLRVTSADTSISLCGITNDNISLVLGTNIKGSKIEVLRGFYNNNYILANTYPRFTGIITSYSISEDRSGTDDNYTVSLNASSYKTILENRTAGRKTNKTSWQVFNPNDSSMNNVYSLSNQQFEFGMDPSKKVITSSSATVTSIDRNDFF